MKSERPMFITKDVPIEPVIEKASDLNSKIIHVKDQQKMAHIILKYLEDIQEIK